MYKMCNFITGWNIDEFYKSLSIFHCNTIHLNFKICVMYAVLLLVFLPCHYSDQLFVNVKYGPY